MEFVTIEAQAERAVIAPEAGFQCRSYRVGSLDIIAGPNDPEADWKSHPFRSGIPILFPWPGRIRDGSAGLLLGPMRRRRPGENGALVVNQQKLEAGRQDLDLFLHQPVEIERSQQDEPQLPRFIVCWIGNLEHGRPGQPTECRLDRRRIGVFQRTLKVAAIAQVEDPPGVE